MGAARPSSMLRLGIMQMAHMMRPRDHMGGTEAMLIFVIDRVRG